MNTQMFSVEQLRAFLVTFIFYQIQQEITNRKSNGDAKKISYVCTHCYRTKHIG